MNYEALSKNDLKNILNDYMIRINTLMSKLSKDMREEQRHRRELHKEYKTIRDELILINKSCGTNPYNSTNRYFACVFSPTILRVATYLYVRTYDEEAVHHVLYDMYTDISCALYTNKDKND